MITSAQGGRIRGILLHRKQLLLCHDSVGFLTPHFTFMLLCVYLWLM